jgi:metallo-beta-lactamase family protein
MFVTSYGAVREVTGSMHLIQSNSDHILFDCGLFQGRRKETEQKNKVIPFDPAMITNLILSHAHIDHSGRIPLLTKKGFSGRIVCTRATYDVCNFLLADSAHIQESDANYLNYKTVRTALLHSKHEPGSRRSPKRTEKEVRALLKKNRNKINKEAIDNLMAQYRLEKIEPLYTKEDAAQALTSFESYPYGEPVSIGQDMSCTFYEAGHILGSAISIIKAKENGNTYTIGYSGDLGRFDKPIIKDPASNFSEEDRNIDLLLLESTYGDRLHEPTGDMKQRLKEVLLENRDRGGSVVIPSFAFGRAQEIIYVLHELYSADEVPKIPIYVDSPLASNLTKVFGEHFELYDQNAHDTFLQKGKNPFSFSYIKFVKSVEESMALMRDETPHIVIASSGMCEAGRILHHLRHKIHSPKNTILIVGYMAKNTLGRKILEEGTAYEKGGRQGNAPIMRFYNKTYPLKARVISLGGFSAHADKTEITRFLKDSNLNIKKIAIIHGEEDQSVAFGDHLSSEGFDVTVPRVGQTLKV